MESDTKVADTLLDNFTQACQSTPINIANCQDLLLQLKLQMITFNLTPPFTENIETVRKKLLISRETLELGAGLAIECKDMAAFCRHISQVKPYYTDYKDLLPESARQWALIGSYLLSLLCQNRIDDFHAELELISIERRTDPCIAFPIAIEQSLMEGSYHKVLNAAVPRPQFNFFVGLLSQTVRERIAECCEKAYARVLIEDAGELLMLDQDATLQQAQKRQWSVVDGRLCFPQEPDMSLDIPSKSMISQSLGYALELERII